MRERSKYVPSIGCGIHSMDRISHGLLPEPNIRKTVKECSMCGDFGITADLFQCRICLSRFQHTYCSHSFPNLPSEMWICNWCLHQNHHNESKWKDESSVVEFEKGNDIKAVKLPKCNVLEMALRVSEVGVDAEAKAGGSTMLLPSSSNSSGETAKNRNIDDRRYGCRIPNCQRNYRQEYAQKKKKEAPLQKCPPQLTQDEMVPRLRPGKRRRYKLLSDVIC